MNEDAGELTPEKVIEIVLFNIAQAAQDLNDYLLPSREKAMALTKLDEARLWTKDIKL